MNNEIISQLTELYQHYKQEKDNFRAIAYARTVDAIKKMRQPITSASQLDGIKGIGPKIKLKVDQFIEEGRIRKLASIKAQQDPKRVAAINDFLTIYGIGPVAAVKLYDEHGIKSLEQLTRASNKDPSLLTAAQKIGLRYREDLLKRIPRDFINTFQFTVAYCLNSAFGETFKLQTAGSFRRNKPTSGDIDIMLESSRFGLKEAVEVLISYGVITDILALDSKKFMGVAVCKGIESVVPFRLDIFMVDDTNWWTALVTHTGPKDLNTMMRAKAAAMGMKLSDQGLWKGDRKLKVTSERDLFKKLGMDYIEPIQR
jgi:DNA polymerase/3'-5' exonuclease PolX